MIRLVQVTNTALAQFHDQRGTVGKIAIYSPLELKRPLQRSLVSASIAGYSPIHCPPSPGTLKLLSARHFRYHLVRSFLRDKVTLLKEADGEPTPSTPGAICQPGIIRFSRSFNEINNGGGETPYERGEGGQRIISTATREDTTEDSLLFSLAVFIYSLVPSARERSEYNHEPWHDVAAKHFCDDIISNTNHHLLSRLNRNFSGIFYVLFNLFWTKLSHSRLKFKLLNKSTILKNHI